MGWKEVLKHLAATLTFLGTGDSMGVPRMYCDCSVCSEARTTGSNKRLRSSVLFETNEGELLIDCGPDWASQMEALQKRDVEHIFITHAHFDHIGGLPEWADACRWLHKKGNLYGHSEVLEMILSLFPWIKNNLHFHAIDEGFTFLGWRIEPWKVCHGKNGFAYAFHFSKYDYSFAYCSDSINLQEEEKSRLLGLDLLILGTSYYQETAELHTRSVYDMIEAMQLVKEVAPKQVIFTHMSHGVDRLFNYPLPEDVSLAWEGRRVEINS
jgi:phosphoribosyl 1,2-cyclic phosphate phosphodiesterase